MPFIEDVARLLLVLVIGTCVVNVLFLWVVFERRLRSQRYFALKDSARAMFRGPVQDLAGGRVSTEDAVRVQREARSRPARDAVEELLLSAMVPGNTIGLSEALFALGAVDRWASQAFGRRRGAALVGRSIRREVPNTPPPLESRLGDSVRRLKVFSFRRALAVSSLGQLAPEFASVFLVQAAADPASEVRQIAVAYMGRSRHPALVPVLVEELRRALQDEHDISWRWVKVACTSFGMEDLDAFVPHLSHPHPEVRTTLLDVAGQIAANAARGGMLNKNDFSLAFYRAVLDQAVVDQSADVRARAPAVIKHFRDQRGRRALRTLLTDENEFVRLHAVRACADRSYDDVLPDVSRRLLDPDWRVRQAAVQSVIAFGTTGLDALSRMFLETEDEETARQMIDGLQRAGAMPLLLAALDSEGIQLSLASAVCHKMAHMGQTVYLNRALASVENDSVRLNLMDALLESPDGEEYVSVLESLASTEAGPVSEKASTILRQSGIRGPVDQS